MAQTGSLFIICFHRPVLIDALPLQSSRLNYELSNFVLIISHNPFKLTLLGFLLGWLWHSPVIKWAWVFLLAQIAFWRVQRGRQI